MTIITRMMIIPTRAIMGGMLKALARVMKITTMKMRVESRLRLLSKSCALVPRRYAGII